MTDYALISKYNYQISPASTFREKLLCRSSDPGQRNTIRGDAAAPLVSKVSHWGN